MSKIKKEKLVESEDIAVDVINNSNCIRILKTDPRYNEQHCRIFGFIIRVGNEDHEISINQDGSLCLDGIISDSITIK